MFNHNSKIFFSIIIPTYNRANLIANTLESALNQTFESYEIIVIDDGGTDDTHNIIGHFNHSKINYFKKENAERGAARNFGILRAKGEYITFLDSDDFLYPDYLDNAYETISKKGFPPFFHLAYEVRVFDGNLLFKANNIRSNEINFLIRGNNLSCMGVFIKRNLIPEYMFNEDRNLAGSEDWELWMRISARYGIIADNRISACIIDHPNRSVLQISDEKLVTRKQLSLKYAFQDKLVEKKFGKYKKQIVASSYIYIALHLTLDKNYERALFHLKNALYLNPFLIFDRRTLAILKRFILRKYSGMEKPRSLHRYEN